MKNKLTPKMKAVLNISAGSHRGWVLIDENFGDYVNDLCKMGYMMPNGEVTSDGMKLVSF